jgi:multidrug efflux pump subunit AcrB
VRVALDPIRLAAHGLSPLELAAALRASNAREAAGSFDATNRVYLVPVFSGPNANDINHLVHFFA